MYSFGTVLLPERHENMNGTKVSAHPSSRTAAKYSGIVYSRVIYDNKLPVMLIMSVDEVLRQRRGDVQRINTLTEKAKQALRTINRR